MTIPSIDRQRRAATKFLHRRRKAPPVCRCYNAAQQLPRCTMGMELPETARKG